MKKYIETRLWVITSLLIGGLIIPVQAQYADPGCMFYFAYPPHPDWLGDRDAVWNFEDGLVVMEAESSHLYAKNNIVVNSNWSFRNDISGALGSGYYEWKNGDASTDTDSPETGVLNYFIRTDISGTYKLMIRTAAPEPTEHNELWVRFPSASVEARQVNGDAIVEIEANTWFKVYQNKGNNEWNFETFTVDNDPHEIFAVINGESVPDGHLGIQLSGRSTLLKVDRLVFFAEYVEESRATDLETPETKCDYLPVELVRFEGIVDGNEIRLNWKTASELNNAGFEVQFADPSDDTFKAIGFVSGAGTTTETKSYTFRHKPVGHAGKKVLYRLKQIDFDGTFSYSDTIEIKMPIKEEIVLYPAYPNPFNPSTRFSFSLPTESAVRLTVYDATGRLVETLVEGVLPAGYHEEFFVISEHLTSGLYLFRLTSETPSV